MRTFLTLLFLGTSVSVFGYNLFVNGGMEDPRSLKSKHNPNETFIDGWYASSSPSPTYFYDSQIGETTAAQGKGFVGLIVYSSKRRRDAKIKKREYIKGVFRKPLEAGKEYYLRFDLALHQTSGWSVSNLGLLFSRSEGASNDLNLRDSMPDIRLNGSKSIEHSEWRTYYVNYRAKGGERSVVFGAFGEFNAMEMKPGIGDFNDGLSHAAFYYIDNFHITDEEPEDGCFTENQVSDGSQRRLTIILDLSSSMKKAKLLSSIKEGVLRSIEGYGRNDQIDLIGFSNGARVLYQGSANMLMSDTLDRLINRSGFSGSTNIYAGLNAAWQLTEDTQTLQSDQLVLISDGEFTISERLRTLLSDRGNRTLHFMHIGHRKNDGADLLALGVDYFLTSPQTLADDLYQSTKPINYANSCDAYPLYEAPHRLSLVLDASGSMRDKRDLLQRFLSEMMMAKLQASDLHVAVSASYIYEDVYVGNSRQFTLDSIQSLTAIIPLKDGTDVEKGVNNVLYEYKDDFTQHYVVVITDIYPSKGDFDEYEYVANRMNYPRDRVIAIYVDEYFERMDLLEYHPDEMRFESMPKGSIPSFLLGMMEGLDRYLALTGMRYRLDGISNKTLKKYRKEYRLLR
ncbi:VWA domain-containing protein [Crocinitomicaceae bacterium]|nr:VWA domain-containing protein [Crocinitomicaceae bacterium]MDB2656816.1 VWA domain-containing protein [Crocinitomicaceae bacterium]